MTKRLAVWLLPLALALQNLEDLRALLPAAIVFHLSGALGLMCWAGPWARMAKPGVFCCSLSRASGRGNHGQLLVAMHFVWRQTGLVNGLPLSQYRGLHLG